MKIQYIPREKAESIAQTKPFLLSQVTISFPSSSFIMITREEVLRVCFDLAIVSRDGEILYLSDPSLEKVVSEFIEENR